MIPDARVSELFDADSTVTQRAKLASLGLQGYSDVAERAAAELDPMRAFGQAMQEQKVDPDVGITKMVQTGGARMRKSKSMKRRKTVRRQRRRQKTVKRTNWLRLTASVRLRSRS